MISNNHIDLKVWETVVTLCILVISTCKECCLSLPNCPLNIQKSNSFKTQLNIMPSVKFFLTQISQNEGILFSLTSFACSFSLFDLRVLKAEFTFYSFMPQSLLQALSHNMLSKIDNNGSSSKEVLPRIALGVGILRIFDHQMLPDLLSRTQRLLAHQPEFHPFSLWKTDGYCEVQNFKMVSCLTKFVDQIWGPKY